MTARTFVRRAGWVLIGVGVLVIAWGLVTWRVGDPVTALYTRWEQHRLATEYRQVAAKHRLRVEPHGHSGPTVAELRRAADRMRRNLRIGEPIGRIIVHRLGLNMILVNGTDTASLRKGPGRDPRTYLPGEGQLVYIAGHRTTFAAPFAHIDAMRPGDLVILEMPYGKFVYSVTGHVIVPAGDLARLRSHGHEVLALQACHPRFSASERYIVYARPTGSGRGRSLAANGR